MEDPQDFLSKKPARNFSTTSARKSTQAKTICTVPEQFRSRALIKYRVATRQYKDARGVLTCGEDDIDGGGGGGVIVAAAVAPGI
ncbi:phosphatidylinositol-4-phosphate 5-kinase-like protein [Corchorus capsularis]|uniref:Phosphatidylinositol-4-phosphate 5-kinase-like protein n=1 Tax=Corchorus capsularis TaxID=210143 RepID=A0A1R3FVX7_COCAP|nr:phosphatidylinositol-4-phosphate 5-kinase-like protein [Corchorus capsularis]